MKPALTAIALLLPATAALAETLPPPTAIETGEIGYYLDMGVPIGPFPLARMQDMAMAGKIGSETPIWHPGMPLWTAAAGLPEIAAAFAPEPAADQGIMIAAAPTAGPVRDDPAQLPAEQPATEQPAAEQPAAEQPAQDAEAAPPAEETTPEQPPQPAQEQPAARYYVDLAGISVGPLTMQQLGQFVGGGQLKPETPVWKEGMQGWAAANTVAEIAALFPAAAPEAQAPEQTPAQPEQAEQTPPQQADEPPAPPPQQAAEDEPPPPPPPPPAVKLYVAVDGKTTGPFTVEEMDAKIAAGEVGRQTLVWRKGDGWVAAEKVPELVRFFDDRPETPPLDCARLLVGVWERSSYAAGQQMILRTALEANGSYNGAYIVPNVGTSTFYGTWTAKAAGETTCSLTTNMEYPTASMSTTVLEKVDEHTMKDKGDGAIVRRIQ